MRRCPDIALAKTYLRWQPKIAPHEGLRRIVDYFMRLVSEPHARP